MRPIHTLQFVESNDCRSIDFNHPTPSKFKSKRWRINIVWDTIRGAPCEEVLKSYDYDTIEEVREVGITLDGIDEVRFTEWRRQGDEFNPYEFLQRQVKFFIDYYKSMGKDIFMSFDSIEDHIDYVSDTSYYDIIMKYNKTFKLYEFKNFITKETFDMYNDLCYQFYSYTKGMYSIFCNNPKLLESEEELKFFLDGGWEKILTVDESN